MKCPQCNACDWRVKDSRHTHKHIYRRRICLNCNCRFTSREVIEIVTSRES